MSDRYETLLHRWFEEVWNQGREEVIDEIFPAHGIAHGLGDEAVRGGENYKVFFRGFRGALPDIKVTVEETVCEGDKIAARCRVQAIHTNLGIGFAPTNQPLDFTFMAFVRTENEQIIEAWNIVDFMKMYQQMGVLTLNQS